MKVNGDSQNVNKLIKETEKQSEVVSQEKEKVPDPKKVPTVPDVVKAQEEEKAKTQNESSTAGKNLSVTV